MYTYSPFEACPRVGTKRRSYVNFVFSGWVPKVALLILIVCMFSACSTVSHPALYAGKELPASTGVGTGDIHALDGNLVW